MQCHGQRSVTDADSMRDEGIGGVSFSMVTQPPTMQGNLSNMARRMLSATVSSRSHGVSMTCLTISERSA